MRNIKLQDGADEYFVKARVRFVKENPSLNPTYERIVMASLKEYANGQ